MKRALGLLVCLSASWTLAAGAAQAASGLYLSSEIGVHFAKGPKLTIAPNDRASICDEFINPLFATVTSVAGFEDTNCTGPNRGAGSGWSNDFGSDRGVLAGLALGYRVRPNVRLEVEYFYREARFDETRDVPLSAGNVNADKLRQEIRSATDRLGALDSHNLFANVYYDFVGAGRLTPYLGVGVGLGFTDLDYTSHWVRNRDVADISTGEGLPNEAQIKQNLAGTYSLARKKLSDTLFGVQAMLGVDYAISETLSLGVKGRYVRYDDLRDDVVWDPLRSHVPNIRRDGSEPVSARVKLDDIEAFGVSLNLKYRF